MNHRTTQITQMPFRQREEKNPFNPLNPVIKNLRAQREETYADNITPRQFINDKEKNNHRITQITQMPFRQREEKNPLNPLNPMIKYLRAQREETSADNIILRQFINDKKKNNHWITQITRMPFR